MRGAGGGAGFGHVRRGPTGWAQLIHRGRDDSLELAIAARREESEDLLVIHSRGAKRLGKRVLGLI